VKKVGKVGKRKIAPSSFVDDGAMHIRIRKARDA